MRSEEGRHAEFKVRVATAAAGVAAPSERMFEKRNREACYNALREEHGRVKAVLERLKAAAPVKAPAGS
ncbi:MAG: hypothetical protein WBW33_23315 [Bryobacteraceae bacterium]